RSSSVLPGPVADDAGEDQRSRAVLENGASALENGPPAGARTRRVPTQTAAEEGRFIEPAGRTSHFHYGGIHGVPARVYGPDDHRHGQKQCARGGGTRRQARRESQFSRQDRPTGKKVRIRSPL